MLQFTIFAATALFATLGAAIPPSQTTKQAMQQPSSTPQAGFAIVQGCFSSVGELKFTETIKFNSRDGCGWTICALKYNMTVGASYRGDQCYCGSKYPPKSSVIDDGQCNIKCPGWEWDACGGANAYTVYNTGIDAFDVEYSSGTSTTTQSTTSKPTSTSGQSSTSSSSSVAPTDTGSSNNTSSTNTAGIAAGVVVGVVASAGIGAGIWWFLRRKRNQEIEDEHRRNAAVNSFINGNKPPSSSGGLSMTDSRMDPTLAQRRMSDGSIADNQDYSRRILRVTNA